MIEGFLRVIDPWGIYYFDDQLELRESYVQLPDGTYTLPEGEYQLTRFSASILMDGTRLVPDTQLSDCVIVTVGDSVTWGHGVNDAETWVNLLARDFPTVQFINAGVNGYNIETVWRSMGRFPNAKGYLYLMTDNDAAFETEWDAKIDGRGVWQNEPAAYMSKYALYLRSVQKHSYPENKLFLHLYLWRIIHDYPKVKIFATGVLLPSLAREAYPDLVEISRVAPISRIDGHPNPAGSRDLALQMQPEVAKFINEVCP